MNYTTKTTALAAAATLALALGSHSALALNITVWDGLGTPPSVGTGEVGETEPNTVIDHKWDNEAFVIKGNKLILISGFNFLTGYGGYGSGDIFINTSGTLPVGTMLPGGNGNQSIAGNMGYEFVLDMNVGGGTFNVIDLTTGPAVTLESGFYRQNDKGNPYRYTSGGTTVFANQGLTLSTLTGAQVQSAYPEVTVSGNLSDANYVLELDMSWFTGNNLDTHYTFGCANDVIVGHAQGGFDVPDAGSSLMLLGLGISSLALAQRRFARKA